MEFSNINFCRKNELHIEEKDLKDGLLKADKFSYVRIKTKNLARETSLYNLFGLQERNDDTYVTLRPGDSLEVDGDVILKKHTGDKYLELVTKNANEYIILRRGGRSCLSFVLPMSFAIVIVGGCVLFRGYEFHI